MWIMWIVGITPTLKFWNPCHFVYKKRITLAAEIMRNWRSTTQIAQPAHLCAKSNLSQKDSYCL